jgi:hypothetical protein
MEISPEATPMTKGGSLAASSPESTVENGQLLRHFKKSRIARTLRDIKRRSR